MPQDVYVVGLFDDYLSCQLVDKSEWDRIIGLRQSLGDIDVNGLTFGGETTFDLKEVFQMVQAGTIRVIDVAEGLYL